MSDRQPTGELADDDDLTVAELKVRKLASIKPVTTVSTWHGFVEWVEELRRVEGTAGLPFVFRGQRDGSWPLQSTLERAVGRIDAETYLAVARAASYEISRVFDITHELPTSEEYREILQQIEEEFRSSRVVAPSEFPDYYSLLVYLRHHGFPSPLLDWTASPYIAAFFAFATPALKTEENDDHVAVFAYEPLTMRAVSISNYDTDRTWVISVGPHVSGAGKGHARHHIQQAEYTVCLSRRTDEAGSTIGFDFADGHETHISSSENMGTIKKIRISRSVRTDALRYFRDHNITEFSLQQTPEALMSDLARRELEKRAETNGG